MYQPKYPPQQPTLEAFVRYVLGELQSVARSQRDKSDAFEFNALAVAPEKPRTGALAYTTAANWNPGNGPGLYEYDGSGWKKVGPPLSGVATLVAGTVTVNLASVTANSRIFVTCQVPGGTPGFLRISARVVGTSFTILSSNAADTSTVAYQVIEP